VSLEELGQQGELDPLLNPLTLPVLHEPALQLSSQQILERRPDLAESVFPILMQRNPNFTLKQMMVVVKIPPDQQQSSADRCRRSGCGLLPMQAMSRRCNIPFRLKRRLKR